jgi:sensor histidine kinase YesM
MLLQPLLENAFKYGIEQTTSVERIRVAATPDRGQLSIKIHNTGSTLPEGWREGIGITNCRERLRVLYGSAASVDIASDADTGVLASIHLPLRSTIG